LKSSNGIDFLIKSINNAESKNIGK
jgi:hypothetical protein